MREVCLFSTHFKMFRLASQNLEVKDINESLEFRESGFYVVFFSRHNDNNLFVTLHSNNKIRGL